MSETTKRSIAIAVVVAALAVLVYGTYLPYRKSRAYIAAIQNGNSATSLDEFLVPFMTALDMRSPVGQPEMVRSFASTVGQIVQQASNNPNPASDSTTILRVLGATLDKYALPVIARRSGASEVQTYSVLQSTDLALFNATKVSNYRKRAERLLNEGLSRSPDRPQFLYPLVTYETEHGDDEVALKYARRIKELWPADKNIDRIIRQLGGDDE